MREGTLHLVYFREYEDSEERYDPCFNIYHTIFRNLPLSQLDRLNNKDFQKKVKEFCDKNFKETASNFTGVSGVEMILGSEYYRTYEDEFGKDVTDQTGDGKISKEKAIIDLSNVDNLDLVGIDEYNVDEVLDDALSGTYVNKEGVLQ